MAIHDLLGTGLVQDPGAVPLVAKVIMSLELRIPFTSTLMALVSPSPRTD